MEVFALNALWLGPVVAGGVSLFLSRRMLLGWLVLHGFIQVLLWIYLYEEGEGLGPVWSFLWFSFGSKPFFYAIGLHPVNVWLLLLTIVVGHAALFYAFSDTPRIRSFFALVFILLGFVQGVFLARDVLLFFIFYEASLVPAFLLIYGWGGAFRRAAAVKFAIFTLGGSVLLMIGILWGYVGRVSGVWEEWRAMPLPAGAWLLMTVGLAVKLPLIPLHSWLGEAHVEADTPVSMLLASLLLKLGGFGLLSWVWMDGKEWAFFLRIWGGVSLLYAAAVATAQTDLKRVIAFTSIGHMALVAIGAGSGSMIGIQGAYHQLFTHGIVSAGLFAWIGLVEKQMGGRSLSFLRGIFAGRSRWQLPAVLLFFAAMGVPGTNLFVSELLVIWGVGVGAGWFWAMLPALSLLLTGVYFLRVYRELAQPMGAVQGVDSGIFFSPREAVVWFLIGWVLVGGVYPQPWLELLSYVGP
ncbi:MAG: NADH-quinone oxidoreductase subunit M [Bacteroidia bacterium]|nr:NADH-quinone oxidoreductase subunit M [Bacteroidia bacterium]